MVTAVREFNDTDGSPYWRIWFSDGEEPMTKSSSHADVAEAFLRDGTACRRVLGGSEGQFLNKLQADVPRVAGPKAFDWSDATAAYLEIRREGRVRKYDKSHVDDIISRCCRALVVPDLAHMGPMDRRATSEQIRNGTYDLKTQDDRDAASALERASIDKDVAAMAPMGIGADIDDDADIPF